MAPSGGCRCAPVWNEGYLVEIDAALACSAAGSPQGMQMELQVALNFLISFLYNKLPRRRVNHFGEELEKALRIKFQVGGRGHRQVSTFSACWSQRAPAGTSACGLATRT